VEQPAPSRQAIKLELATEVLRASGELRFVASGASMVPAIFPGDILIVRNQPIERTRSGDVALWSREGRFYAHRVVRTAKAGERAAIVTRGDALNQDDPPVGSDEFLGHVCGVVRRGKHVDLGASPSFGALVLQFMVRRFDGVTKCLLRYSSLRWWLAGNEIASPPSNQPELQECL
jgi:signal peptidase